MTYREHLQRLLNEAIQKSEMYFEVGDDTGEGGAPLNGAHSEKLRQAHEEWQAARFTYNAFMEFMERNCIRGDEVMPD